MNVASDDHGGSSRSHAALILTLHQNDGGKYQKTEFHLVDLAGAERPLKTSAERSSMYEIMTKVMYGKPFDIGDQALLINYELAEIATAVSKATEVNNKGKIYQA